MSFMLVFAKETAAGRATLAIWGDVVKLDQAIAVARRLRETLLHGDCGDQVTVDDQLDFSR